MFRKKMKTELCAVVATVMALTSHPALAQETSQSDQIANDLSLGEEVDESPQVGETYIKEQFNDWAVRCVVAAEGDDPCQLYQLLTDDQNSPIAEVTLLKLPARAPAIAAMNVIVPLETALQEQLTIKVDDSPALRYPFALCNQVGCYARIGLEQDRLDAYKNGSVAAISIVPFAAPDQRVSVELSLSGFTAAFESLADAS